MSFRKFCFPGTFIILTVLVGTYIAPALAGKNDTNNTTGNGEPLGSRERVIKELEQYQPGTVGAASLNPVQKFFNDCKNFTGNGNFAAGNVDKFFTDPKTKEILSLPNTEQNRLLATKKETEFWQTQRGIAGVVGRSINENDRKTILEGGDHMNSDTTKCSFIDFSQ